MTTGVPSTPLDEADYETIEAAVMETARGRWFLTEFAARSRALDAAGVLSAITRLESALRPHEVAPAPDPFVGIRPDLSEAMRIVKRARAELAEGRDAGTDSTQRETDPPTTVVRRVASKIQEVAFDLREAGRKLYADALDLYAADLNGAASKDEKSAQKLLELTRAFNAIEMRLRTVALRVGTEDGPVSDRTRTVTKLHDRLLATAPRRPTATPLTSTPAPAPMAATPAARQTTPSARPAVAAMAAATPTPIPAVFGSVSKTIAPSPKPAADGSAVPPAPDAGSTTASPAAATSASLLERPAAASTSDEVLFLVG